MSVDQKTNPKSRGYSKFEGHLMTHSTRAELSYKITFVLSENPEIRTFLAQFNHPIGDQDWCLGNIRRVKLSSVRSNRN